VTGYMKTLYSFIASLCKDQDMKLEDLQKKLNTSRTTLYRYMKGINQITPDVAQGIIEALNMNIQQSLEFSKFVSLSAFDHSLIESRAVLDDFMFGKKTESKSLFDIEMIFYNNDKYFRTLKEVLDHIYSLRSEKGISGVLKIYNCMSENIFAYLTEYLNRVLSEGIDLEVEQFVGLSEKDYLQNTYSFINTFPLMKYEKYRFYFRESESSDRMMPDSALMALKFTRDGKEVNQYFSFSFYEDSLAECIAFNDDYMYSFLSKYYENLKSSYKNVMKKYDNIDFNDDIFTEMQKYGDNCLVKPNPCYDKIPMEVYNSLLKRMNSEELIKLLSSVTGQKIEPHLLPAALEKTNKYLMRRVENTTSSKRIDIYCEPGMIEFVETGKLTDHLENLPAFNAEEKNMILKYLLERSNCTETNYSLYITKDSLSHKDMIFVVIRDFGVTIEYILPENKEGLWKVVVIQNARLASIFFDYFDNHIPINKALDAEATSDFIQSLIDA